MNGGGKAAGSKGAGKLAGLGTTGGGPAAVGSTTPTGSTGRGPVGTVHVASGVTRGGYRCRSGVHQLAYSQYAAPCVARFTGNNGGATWNGVTGTTITVAMRHTSDSSGANAKAVDAAAEAAGGVSPDTEEAYVRRLVAYFNKTFELYGRQVKIVDFNGQGNGNNEQLGQDQAGACADADTAATSVHAFADLQWNGLYEYPPFAACAPRYHLVVPFGALYYPESDYQKWNPYVWSITTSCTIGGTELAEFLGKQIAPYPAKWAGNDGPLNMSWYGTGNNVQLHADTSRRVCHVRMETMDEKPELKSGFKYPRLREHVRRHRAKLLAAALTILRGFIVAGRPSHNLPAWGSFGMCS